jgi:hypothetical protein
MDNEQFFKRYYFNAAPSKRGLIKFDGTRENIQKENDNTDLKKIEDFIELFHSAGSDP